MSLSTFHREEAASCQHDFSDNEGFVAEKWGFIVWNTMHVFGMYADQIREYTPMMKYRGLLRNWIAQLTAVLFCSACRQRFELYVAASPLVAFDHPEQTCTVLTFDIHNAVNCKLGHMCLGQDSFGAMRSKYESMLNYKDTNLLSPDWQLSFATSLFLAALNFPASFNPELPRHRMLEQSYREWMWISFALLPDTDPTNPASFSRKSQAALGKPYNAHTTEDGFHYTTTGTMPRIDYTYATFLKTAPLTRHSLYHWVYDITRLIWGGTVLGTCTSTQEYIEHLYRFRDSSLDK